MAEKQYSKHRKHTCKCGHEWYAPVVKTTETFSLTGEKAIFCPKCFRRSFMAGPADDCSEGAKGLCHVCRQYVGD